MPNYFIGINLSETTLSQSMRTLQRRLGRDLEWAYTNAPHMTLVYLGPTSEEEIEIISDQLSSLLDGVQSTKIQIFDIEIWRTYRHIGVLIMKENKILSEIQEKIALKLAVYLPPAKKHQIFIPHMTLFASKKPLKKSALSALQKVKETLKHLPQKIDAISLMYIDPDSKKIITVKKYLLL